MKARHMLNAVIGAAMVAGLASTAQALMSVDVEIENASGEAKIDWPVVMTVRRIFGSNLAPGAVERDGFHVYDADGKELGWAIEAIPPYDQIGNDELIFLVPKIAPGQKVTYRVTNTDQPGRKVEIDLVANPHNLVGNGGFEAGAEMPDGFSGKGVRDTAVKRSGQASLRLQGKRRQRIKLDAPIALRKDARYYFGAWGKTDNVSRHGLWMSKGGYFDLPGFSNGYGGDLMPAADTRAKTNAKRLAERLAKRRQATVYPQCATRDWAKVTFRTWDYTEWGVEQLTATATQDETKLAIVLDQQKQFFMADDKTEGTWWVDDVVLMEQPNVTVRFDKQLAPLMTDGVFLFTRPTSSPLGNYLTRWTPYCAMPFAHEAVTRIDRVGMRGQRVPFVLGMYHTKPLGTVEVSVKGGALTTADGRKLPLTEIEYLPGFLLEATDGMLMRTVTGPVDAEQAPRIPYFVASFAIPGDAKPGKYTGSLDVRIAGKPYRSIPISLAVQDLDEPNIRDTFLSFIWQGKRIVPFSDEALTQFAKTGFNSLTPFFTFLKFKSVDPPEVDFEDLKAKIDRLLRFGLNGGLCLYTDFDLGSRHSGGSVWRKVKTEANYKKVVKDVYDEFARHPEWPRIIFMTWDEPNLGEKWVPGKHGGPDPRMGWVNEIRPDALTNVDVHFKTFGACLPYYTMPTFDDPPDFCGPELYRYVKSLGKDFGFAGAKEPGECPRYEIGMMMIASGGRYFHQWHLQFPSRLLDVVDGRVLRSYETVQVSEGIADFKVHRVLQNLIAEANASGDAKRRAIAAEAQGYLEQIHKIWNADHINEACYPYLGYAYQWSYDRFYDDWRRQMMKYAVDLKGVAWVE